MHDVVLVTEGERRQQLPKEPLGVRLEHAASTIDLGVVQAEQVGVHGAHDEEQAVVAVRADFVQRHNVGVLEAHEQRNLAHDSNRVAASCVAPHFLHRDRLARRVVQIECLVDLSVCARARNNNNNNNNNKKTKTKKVQRGKRADACQRLADNETKR